ncbi:MAG: M61 family metallopeptidase [Burkholderiales bacterium]
MAATSHPIHYRIRPSHPEAHLFEVELTLRQPDPGGQRFSLPAWIPGSYMIREFARHIVRIQARCGRRPVELEKLDKHTWRAEPCAGSLVVRYQVYAWDFSVRGAHLDTTHGFFNGTSVFLRVEGQADHACRIEIEAPRGAAYRRWRIATAMTPAGAQAHGFGAYSAADYDELIDHPVEMGEFSLLGFRAHDIPHEVAITGRHDADTDRLARDLERLTEHHIDFFGRPAPMRRYVFLVTAVGEGYGGLEHRASTALVCSRHDLPLADGSEAQEERYRTFLGLASHEYFHTWNVKRIKPAAFTPYDLSTENYTRLLWAFEGITSYYDDLALVHTRLMTREQYLRALARTMTAVQRGSGRLKQSLADSSFDAWIKFYRQDENAPNAIVSYYAKGSLVALALDLTVRKATGGRRSLDDVMRVLWREYGRTGRGVDEDAIERLAERVTGVRLNRFFDRAVRGTEDLPWEPLLRAFGVRLTVSAAQSNADRGGGKPPAKAQERSVLGVRIDTAGGEVKLTQVFDDGAAQAAELSAGDILIALDGLRITPSNWEQVVARYRPGAVVRASAFRRDELIERRVRLHAAPRDTCFLSIDERASRAQRQLLDGWLGRPERSAAAPPARRGRRRANTN